MKIAYCELVYQIATMILQNFFPFTLSWHENIEQNSLHLAFKYTGCKRRIRKTFEVKIWKETLLVEKQTIPQQKALNLSFNLAP